MSSHTSTDSDENNSALWFSILRWTEIKCRSSTLEKTGADIYRGEISVAGDMKTLDVITVHAQEENGSTLTVSGPEICLE